MMPPSSSSAASSLASSLSKSPSVQAQFLRHGLPHGYSPAVNGYAPVGKWILGTAGTVVAMIHIGGVTRLTQSGLSMTNWTPLGSLPPMTHDEWTEEFTRYQQFPEWQQRKNMTLDEFKYIYAWEYGHRMLGRGVGLFFLLPWAYFTATRRIPTGYQGRMIGLLTMGASQGLVGWWMVKSGLGEDRRGDSHQIRVKPIRLATHLTMAVATYGALVWTGWDILGLHHTTNHISQNVAKLGNETLRHATRLRTGGMAVTALTALTIVSGALVAGNDAGRAYNTFPLMNGQWIPSEITQDWKPRNIMDDTTTVQWNHRVLGSATAISAIGLAAVGLRRPTLVTPQVRQGLYAVGFTATAQVTLGITTLLTYVPISLAAAHQMGSIAVFTSGLYLVHSLRYVRPAILKSVGRLGK